MAIIYFILILGVTVFIHEFGHFLFAKKAGIYCYEFSLGMGPRLFKFKRKNDETEYSIRLFPIGGYVSMAGESVEEDKNVPKNKLIQSKTWLQRFLTIIAGIAFNFILSAIIFFCIALIYGAQTNVPYVGKIVEGSSAEISGLKENDKFISMNGKKTNNIDKFALELTVNNGKKLELVIERNNELKKITVEPEKEEENFTYGFGITTNVEKGLIPSIRFAFSKLISLISQMILVIWYLITGTLSLNTLSGPIGIFNLVSDTAKTGFINIIYLLGIISVNVGFINLLPVPAFDGGRILFLIIEKIKGKPVSAKTENIIHSIGFALLMILMVAITYNDILKLIR